MAANVTHIFYFATTIMCFLIFLQKIKNFTSFSPGSVKDMKRDGVKKIKPCLFTATKS